MCRTNRQLGNKINSHQENALKRQQQAVAMWSRCGSKVLQQFRTHNSCLLVATWSCHRPFGWERASACHTLTQLATPATASAHTIIVATDDDAARYQQKLRFNCHVFMPHSPHLGARRLMPPQAATARCTLHLKLQQSSSAAQRARQNSPKNEKDPTSN